MDNMNEDNIVELASSITTAYITVHSNDFKEIDKKSFNTIYLKLFSENLKELQAQLKLNEVIAQRQNMSNDVSNNSNKLSADFFDKPLGRI